MIRTGKRISNVNIENGSCCRTVPAFFVESEVIYPAEVKSRRRDMAEGWTTDIDGKKMRKRRQIRVI